MAALWLTVGAVHSTGLIRPRQCGLAILVPHPSSPMLCPFSPLPSPLHPLNLCQPLLIFTISRILSLPGFHSGGIIERATLSAWFLSFNNKYLALLSEFARHHCPCFLPADLEWVSVCHLPMEGQLSCFKGLTSLNKVAFWVWWYRC